VKIQVQGYANTPKPSKPALAVYLNAKYLDRVREKIIRLFEVCYPMHHPKPTLQFLREVVQLFHVPHSTNLTHLVQNGLPSYLKNVENVDSRARLIRQDIAIRQAAGVKAVTPHMSHVITEYWVLMRALSVKEHVTWPDALTRAKSFGKKRTFVVNPRDGQVYACYQ
jgi:hypothetical protein